MDNLVNTLTNSDFLIAALAAISAAAVVFTLGSSLFGGGSQIKERIKRVALEREKMRALEMARLRGGGPEEPRSIRRVADHSIRSTQLQAHVAGADPLPDRWHGSSTTKSADWRSSRRRTWTRRGAHLERLAQHCGSG